MLRRVFLATLTTVHLVHAQQIGDVPEIHPKLQTWKCTTKNGCTPQETSVVLDALSHSLHEVGSTSISCGDWSGLNKTLCATDEDCAKNCVLEGVDYASRGVSTNGDQLVLHQYLQSNNETTVASPRVYLLDESGKNYDILRLLNQELSFDVDVSSLVCGMNGALYLSEMLQSGGRSELNPAGAQYGTGYCDAQCPATPFINGVANVEAKGACCNEMDLWEANSLSTGIRLTRCNGEECGSEGVCDKSGCGFNPYALGDHDYYGHKKLVDTSRRFTVVTQFITDLEDEENLVQVRRLYVQDGTVIQNAVVETAGMEIDSLTDEYCSTTASYFAEMVSGMIRGAFMNWLDSGDAGPCNSTEGDPKLIQAQHPGTSVSFSNIRWGDIGSTYVG
ncbi:uncharacterized protein N7477_000994 [Penicillium maclennaniae]|uniref:uncharacterized protein n=1 Tax=Penicillium maclennaniae TaxID=1343394 RepID=UPI002540C59B|nr:uncharacterized protein N7477_000994 [Penicillium maclennaniae]KAJ5684649.1 hypothetical protein N7477_000994 [Penicillium maclennaniae]